MAKRRGALPTSDVTGAGSAMPTSRPTGYATVSSQKKSNNKKTAKKPQSNLSKTKGYMKSVSQMYRNAVRNTNGTSTAKRPKVPNTKKTGGTSTR